MIKWMEKKMDKDGQLVLGFGDLGVSRNKGSLKPRDHTGTMDYRVPLRDCIGDYLERHPVQPDTSLSRFRVWGFKIGVPFWSP